MGNIMQNTIYEIWTGKNLIEIIEKSYLMVKEQVNHVLIVMLMVHSLVQIMQMNGKKFIKLQLNKIYD